jgi:hypothetical protein
MTDAQRNLLRHLLDRQRAFQVLSQVAIDLAFLP